MKISNDDDDSDGRADYDRQRVTIDFKAPKYGKRDVSFDFGFVQHVIVGDFVWLDTNANGLQDSAEVGIANVLVQLTNEAGLVLADTRTSSGGKYEFTSVEHPLLPDEVYFISLNLNQVLCLFCKTTTITTTNRIFKK